MGRDDMAWPMYFAATSMTRPGKINLRAGEPFPVQDKAFIRGVGAGFGCADAWNRSFSTLPYVAVLNVYSETMARHIADRGLTLEQARQLVEGEPNSSEAGTIEGAAAPAPSPAPRRRRGRPPKRREPTAEASTHVEL